MEALKDGSHLYEVQRRAEHAARPGFRITEFEISSTQKVPWHLHSNVQDTFYVIDGQLRLFLREPKEEVRVSPGDTYSVRPGRPHLVTNGGDGSATFLVLQGIGSTLVPLVSPQPDRLRRDGTGAGCGSSPSSRVPHRARCGMRWRRPPSARHSVNRSRTGKLHPGTTSSTPRDSFSLSTRTSLTER